MSLDALLLVTWHALAWSSDLLKFKPAMSLGALLLVTWLALVWFNALQIFRLVTSWAVPLVIWHALVLLSAVPKLSQKHNHAFFASCFKRILLRWINGVYWITLRVKFKE
jgi:hypothetical protein